MAITTYAGEKLVSDIATRVFGDLPPAQLKLAEEALLEANPHLKFDLQSQVAQIDAANKQRDAFAAETGTFAKKTMAEIQKDLEDLIARIG